MKAMSEKHPDLSEKRKRTAAEIMASSRQQYVISWILTALVRLAAALAVLTVVHLDWIYFGNRRTPFKLGPVCLEIHHPKPVYDAGPGQHRLHDAAHPPGGGTHWRLCSHLPGGVCQTGQQAGKAGPSDRRDPFRDSLHCLWAVRLCIFQCCLSLELFHAGRFHDPGHYDFAPHFADHGGGPFVCAGFLPGGVLWLGRGAATDGFPGYPAFGYALGFWPV